jgi:hypothetical protein
VALGLAAPWIAAPLWVLRFAASSTQTWLNVQLGKRQPVAKADRYDWMLLAGIFALAEAGAIARAATFPVPVTALVLVMMLPFTLLQLRMAARSYRAHAHAAAFEIAIARATQWAQRQRMEPAATAPERGHEPGRLAA